MEICKEYKPERRDYKMSSEYNKILRVLWIILFANIAVAMTKIIVGRRIQSTSMVADGFHSLTDGSSNVIGIIGVKIASRPVDKEHPYGHKKFETMAGLFIAVMLFLMGMEVIKEAAVRIIAPVQPQISVASLVALGATLIVNIAVSKIEYAQGKKLGSDVLISDSLHTKSDVFVTIGVFSTLALIKIGFPPIMDTWVSFVVAGFIMNAAYGIFKRAGSVLVDKYAVDEELIRSTVMGFKSVKDVHKIRSRGREDDVYVDLHIMVDPKMSIEQAHELEHEIEKKIRSVVCENIQVIAHIEPYCGEHETED